MNISDGYHRPKMQLNKEGSSKGLFFFSFFVFILLATLIVGFLIKSFPRNYYKVDNISSMKDDGTSLSPHERAKLLEIMSRVRDNAGLSISFHIAEKDPVPRRSGPNAFTIGISTQNQSIKYRVPFAFREMLGASETDQFISNLQTRYKRCLDLPITRKVAHCLEDTMVAIEEKTINHPRANMLIIDSEK